MTLEWDNHPTLGTDWTARNDMGDGWLASYEIAVMEAGDFRVWGLMRNRHQRQGERSVSTLDDAKAVAQDDYERRQRAEAWREYTETHDPPPDQDPNPILEAGEYYIDTDEVVRREGDGKTAWAV